MTHRIIAFFASSFLCVSFTIPAVAEEKYGIIVDVDQNLALLTFADGSTYQLPEAFNYDAVHPGMEAHVIIGPREPTGA